MSDVQTTIREREEGDLHYWRIARFEELGFERHQAEILELSDVDWHDAESLCREGCHPATAVMILT